MATYDVKLWSTAELYNNKGVTPLDRAETYIQGAFDNTGNFVNLSQSSDRVPAPTENPQASFEANYPCDKTFDIQYDRLPDWFDDWLSCNSSEVSDCNLLITYYVDDNNGYYIENSDGVSYAAAAGGQYVEDVPSSYTTEGCRYDFNAMETVLHETSHCLSALDADTCHRTGDILNQDGNSYATPMASSGTYAENYCGDDVDRSGPDDDCFKMYWNRCNVDNWE